MKRIILLIALITAGAITMAQGYKIGDVAKDFKLKNVDGKMVSMADYKDAKGFIVIFTCNHCPYAKAYEDRIIELDKEFKSKGFPVIAINPNNEKIVPEDSFDKMVKRSEEKNFTFPYLHDVKQEVFKMYGATRTPHVYILNKKDGKLKVAYIGTIDNNYKDASKADTHYVQSAVNMLLKGEKPDPDFTKAVGCSIKYKKDA